MKHLTLNSTLEANIIRQADQTSKRSLAKTYKHAHLKESLMNR